jgi:hypothetical protein
MISSRLALTPADHAAEHVGVPGVRGLGFRNIDGVRPRAVDQEAVLDSVLDPVVPGQASEVVDPPNASVHGAREVDLREAAVLPGEPPGDAIRVEVAAADDAEIVDIEGRCERPPWDIERRESAVAKEEAVDVPVGVGPTSDDVAPLV